MAPTRVLVTGGAGFIGQALVTALLEIGVRVALLDTKRPAGRHTIVGTDGVTCLQGDVRDLHTCHAAADRVRPDVVVHLAAETSTSGSLAAPGLQAAVNVVGTANVMEALARHRPAHVVLASSRAVYGEGLWRYESSLVLPAPQRREVDLALGCFDPALPPDRRWQPLPHAAGSTPTRPVSVYGATKLAQEHLLTAWGSALGVPVSVLRFQNVYGPGQSTTGGTSVLTGFAHLAVRRERIAVFEDGCVARDFLHIDDAVGALVAAIECPPHTSRTVDIGTGAPATLLHAASALADLAGAPAPLVTGAFRLGDVRSAACDPSAAADELGVTAGVQLEGGLDRLLACVSRPLAGAPAPARTR